MHGAVMTWMRMPGQSWPGAAASFLGMWIAMTAAMMLPVAIPMLRRRHAAIAGAGYLAVWATLGVVVFPLGATLAAVQMAHPSLAGAAPVAGAAVVLLAGAHQLSARKAHHLACCRHERAHGRPLPGAGDAWRHGLRLGVHCVRCCANLMAIQLVLGVMNGWLMLAVGLAIAAERLLPAGARMARAMGVVIVGAGLVMATRAAHLGR